MFFTENIQGFHPRPSSHLLATKENLFPLSPIRIMKGLIQALVSISEETKTNKIKEQGQGERGVAQTESVWGDEVISQR